MPCFICSSTLVRPAMPAADSQWPMFDLAEPIQHSRLTAACALPAAALKALVRPAISIGSPSLVPVPCAST
ncbi:hypothetical protein D3C87_2125510 [compost metagenome]